MGVKEVRKQINADEGFFDSAVRLTNGRNKTQVMNDIMYYLRKLFKLARRASALNLSEGKEIEDMSDIDKEFIALKEEIEKTMGFE